MVAIAVLAVAGLLVWEATLLNTLFLVLLGAWPIWLLLGIGVGAALGATYTNIRSGRSAGTAVAVLSGFWLVLFGISASYWQAQVYLQHATTKDAADAPVFAERAALSVARNQAQGRITTNGTLAQSAYLPQTDRFTSLVEQSSNMFGGYTEIVNQQTAFTGQTTTDNCRFNAAAGKRLGGLLWADLGRQIVWQAGPGIDFSQADAYGYCAHAADDTLVAKVVVPLKVQTGGWPRIGQPAGVALYDGGSGALEIVRDPKVIAGIPGPTLPESVARELRESTAAMGSWWEYTTGVAGFTDTSADELDPNADNRSEFVLATTSNPDQAVFVTPLTRRGGSTAIAALGVVGPDQRQHVTAADNMPHLTVYLYGPGDERQANSTTADRIKADFGDLAWASGLQVFEITPVSTNEWVASIGLRQNVTHRVRIAPDGSACLETADGRAIRCSGDNQEPQPAPSDPTTPVTDLDQLTDEQLADLADAVNAEVSKRLRGDDHVE